MKKITSAMVLLGSLLYADYTMVYKMQDPEDPKNIMTSTFRYKDGEHGRIDMKTQEQSTASSMLVKGKKAYIISYEDGKPQVMDMDELMKMGSMFGGGMPDETEESSEEPWDNMVWKKTGKNKKVAGFKGEIWEVTVDEDGKKQTHEIVMTKDRDYLKAIKAYEAVMKRMVSGGGEAPNEMYTMVHEGYAPVEVDGTQMRLESFSDANVDAAVFELPEGTESKKSAFGSMFASGGSKGSADKSGTVVDACYSELCCGSTQGESDVLAKMVAPSAEGYKLDGSAKCDALGLGALFGVDSVEGALYKKEDKTVTVTLDTDAKNKGVVLQTRDAQEHGGVQATGYKSGFIGEYTYHYAVLQPMNVQQLDIVIDSHTLLSFSHRVEQGKVPMVKFAKEAIDFDAYTPAATKKKAQQTKEKSAASSVSDDEGADTRESINKGVDDAVEMFKSLF